MTKTRRSFTDEFKREAVKLVKQPGVKVTHIARDLGIEQSVLRRWVDQERVASWICGPAGPFEVRRRAKSNGCSVNCAASRWSATS
jgi:transposase